MNPFAEASISAVVPSFARRSDSRAAFEELSHQFHVAARGRPHERREAAAVCRVDRGALGEQFPGSGEFSEFRRLEQVSVRSGGLGRRRRLAQQQTDKDEMETGTCIVYSGRQRDALGVREDLLGRLAAPHLDDRRRTLSRLDARRGARRDHHMDRRACGISQQIAVARSVGRGDVLDALHGDRQRARVSGLARRLPRFDPAANPRPVFGNLHACHPLPAMPPVSAGYRRRPRRRAAPMSSPAS